MLVLATLLLLPSAARCMEEPLLIQLLSTNDETSLKARGILKRISKYSQAELTPYLMYGLQDAEAKVRKNAVMALATIGPDSIRVGRALQQALKDQDSDVRAMALTALHRKPIELSHQASMFGSFQYMIMKFFQNLRFFAH